ncbi:MAG: ATP synthase subunit I [Myxococcales bacterium]|nr:ATP synthase subunit I [Myxococcales bacterium]
MNLDSMVRIERLNYALGGIAVIAAALSQPRSIALGIAVGVALTCLNFAVVSRLVARYTRDAARGDAGNHMLLVLPKMMLLMAAVVASLWLLPINAAAFAAGYSIFIVSILVESVHAALRPPQDPQPQ